MTDPKNFDVVLFPIPFFARRPRRSRPAKVKGVEGMFERMFESQGAGLAAPQVGLSMRLFVLNDEGDGTSPS